MKYRYFLIFNIFMLSTSPWYILTLYTPPVAFSCTEGEFLDMQTQQCQKCAAGTFSMGTGVVFDEWDSLPTGFVTHGMNTNGEDTNTDCSKLVGLTLFVVGAYCFCNSVQLIH